MPVDPSGATIWLTGLSGSGKTTIARALHAALLDAGRRAEVLDGDEIRRTMNADLGFSQADRDANVRRIGFIARLLSRNGVIVIVASISPSGAVRREVRESHESRFLEVFVDCPLDELRARDPKGLYKRAMAGELTGLTGVDAPYDRPSEPDVHVRTDRTPVDVCAEAVLRELRRADAR